MLWLNRTKLTTHSKHTTWIKKKKKRKKATFGSLYRNLPQFLIKEFLKLGF